MVKMGMDRRRIPLDAKCGFYVEQVKRIIVPQIVGKYVPREESKAVLRGLEEELKTVQDIK